MLEDLCVKMHSLECLEQNFMFATCCQKVQKKDNKSVCVQKHLGRHGDKCDNSTLTGGKSG